MNILKEQKYYKLAVNKGIKIFSLLVYLIICTDIASAGELTQLRYTNLPGDKVQINIEASGLVSEPGVFSTADPARIAFDFFGVSKGIVENLVKVGIGNVESIVAVETGDRTRLVVNLLETTPYTSQLTDSGYVITLDGPSYQVQDSSLPGLDAKTGAFAYTSDLESVKYINSVDFRRTAKGGGKLIIDLSDPSISVGVQDLNGTINLNFNNSELVPGLEKRLDVLDFATPVNSVEMFQDGPGAKIVLSTGARYRQISYQSGSEFTIIVDPYVETAAEKEERENKESKYKGERLSINFQKIEVRAALSVISDFTGINIVTSDDVEGELTLSLQDVPWDEALDVILKTKGLDKRKSGEVIYIAPSAKLAENDANDRAAKEALARVEPLVSEIIRINFAEAEVLRDVLLGKDNEKDEKKDKNAATVINLGGDSSGAGSTADSSPNSQKTTLVITADKRSNSLIVTTNQENLIAIKKLIKKLDTPLRQVLIETRIVEASDSFSRTLGAKLGFQRVTDNPTVPGSSSILADRSVVGGSDVGSFSSLIDGSALTGAANNVDLGASAIGTQSAASYALQLFKAGRGYSNLISLELSALEAEGGGKIVASPRIVATDNKESVISQGQERIVVVSSEVDPTTGRRVIITREQKALLQLKVTPKITPDDRVVLNVDVIQDFFTDATTVNRKKVETQVLLDNGETIVIGGIFQESEAENVTKVPVLGDLPVVRHLFRKKSTDTRRTELIVFLTPKLIDKALNLN